MNAPDKIYIPENLPNSDKIRLSSVDKKGRGIPYIHKEAILGWAKTKHMELDPPQNERDFGRIEAVEELINHIESL